MNENINLEKRKASDAARLQSIKRRKHERTVRVKHVSAALNNLEVSTPKNKKIIFDSGSEEEQPSKNLSEEKLNLLGTSSSEDEDCDKHFEIKKQFEGEKGKQLLEWSSAISDERFKLLDENFKEDDDESSHSSPDESVEKISEDSKETKSEREKNFEILEKVLGFQVQRKRADPEQDPEKWKKKKYVRFDPESENASDYIRKPSQESDDESKMQEDNEQQDNENSAVAPEVSGERFFEVATNLKQILSSSNEPFVLTQKFTSDEEMKGFSSQHTEKDNPQSNISPEGQSHVINNNSTEETDLLQKRIETAKNEIIGASRARQRFFIQPNDSRLKEGIEFFKRPGPLDKVREQWPTIRECLVEAYKRNRKIGPRQRAKNVNRQKRFHKHRSTF